MRLESEHYPSRDPFIARVIGSAGAEAIKSKISEPADGSADSAQLVLPSLCFFEGGGVGSAQRYYFPASFQS
jgi:hypothetical protein